MSRRRARRARALAACLLAAALGCRETPAAPPAPGGAASPAPESGAAADLRTTDGAIAVGNLDAQIAATERLAGKRPLSVRERAGQVELLVQRGRFLARVSDYEAAARLADALVAEAPADPFAHLARAQTCAALHLFAEATAALDEAARLGAPSHAVDAVRAGVLQGVGRTDEALALRVRLSERRPDILTLGAEATLRAARGELTAAERLFGQALASYRDVSPFPVAWIEFQQGLVWMREDDFPRAREHLAAAHRRLPQYAEATVHLAEVEAALGNVDRAVAVLRPLAEGSEDPDHAAQLARILAESGQEAEARAWRDRAAAGYETLLAKHPEAFADHAAEFWLGPGEDPARALAYAEANVRLRPTVRAWELVLRAARAAGDEERACVAVREVRRAGYLSASAREVVRGVAAGCGDDGE